MASNEDQVLNISEKDLFAIFAKTDNAFSKSTTVSNKDYVVEFENQVPKSFKSNSTKSLDDLLMPHIRRYKRKKQSKISTKSIISAASCDIVLSFERNHVTLCGDGPSDPKRKRGPENVTTNFCHSYKDFPDLSGNRQRVVTEPLINMLEQFIEVSQYSITINQLLGYLLMRENTNSKEDFAYSCGNTLYQSDTTDRSTIRFSAMEAVSLMHTLSMSKEDMRCIRQFLMSKDIEFPTTNELLEARKKLRPESESVLDGKGRSVNYTDLVLTTAKSILSVINL